MDFEPLNSKKTMAYDEGNAIASVRITHPMATSNDVPR